jgi:hypothetical protein
MPEYIIYRGNMPTVRFSKADANAAVASGLYRWTPLKAVQPVPTPVPAVPADDEADDGPTVVEVPPEWQWETQPSPEAVNLNTAELQALVDLPGGVGIATAKKIVDARPLKTIEDAIAVYRRADWQSLYDEKLIYFGNPNG